MEGRGLCHRQLQEWRLQWRELHRLRVQHLSGGQLSGLQEPAGGLRYRRQCRRAHEPAAVAGRDVEPAALLGEPFASTSETYDTICDSFNRACYDELFEWIPKFKEQGGFSTFRFDDFLDSRVRAECADGHAFVEARGVDEIGEKRRRSAGPGETRSQAG